MKFAPRAGLFLIFFSLSVCLLNAQSQFSVVTKENFHKSDRMHQLLDQSSLQVSSKFHKSNASPLLQDGAGVLVGTMWNGYTSQSRVTNQVAYDPFSGLVTVLYRGGANSSGELVINSSTDRGTSWKGPGNAINSSIVNPAGVVAARHPSIAMYNPTQSTNPSDVEVASLWSQLGGTANTWLEVGYVGGKYGTTYTGGKLSPGSPLLFIPSRIAIAPQTGAMFSLIQTLDPSQQLATGEYFLMKSVNNGKTWIVDLNTPVFTEPLIDGYELYDSPLLDVSPDGQTVAISFMGILVNSGSFSFVDNRLGLVVSKDGGATFSEPELIPFSNLNISNVLVDEDRSFFYPSQAMTVDANGDPHFLITISGDYFFIPPDWRDSTYIGEVVKNKSTNAWDFVAFSAVNNGRLTKFYGAPGRQTTVTYWGEHEFAKSVDGNKIYAKWIDTDSLFNVAGNTLVAIDSTHEIFVSGRDIRSNSPDNGWVQPVNITNTHEFGEKYSKIANFVGADNTIHVIYSTFGATEWRPGIEILDADDQIESYIYYIPGVVLDVAVGTDNTPTPSSFTLSQNYPNPFNPVTNISFSLPTSGRASIKVFNSIGKEVATVMDRTMDAGSHTVQFNASSLPSGQYFYRLESGSFVATKALTLIK